MPPQTEPCFPPAAIMGYAPNLPPAVTALLSVSGAGGNPHFFFPADYRMRTGSILPSLWRLLGRKQNGVFHCFSSRKRRCQYCLPLSTIRKKHWCFPRLIGLQEQQHPQAHKTCHCGKNRPWSVHGFDPPITPPVGDRRTSVSALILYQLQICTHTAETGNCGCNPIPQIYFHSMPSFLPNRSSGWCTMYLKHYYKMFHNNNKIKNASILKNYSVKFTVAGSPIHLILKRPK